MTKTEFLEQYANDKGIALDYFSLGKKKAFCIPGRIIIDKDKVETIHEYRNILAEEIGHCVQNVFYPLSICYNENQHYLINKAERQAKDFAVKLLVPLCALKKAIKTYSNDYEIAEALEVDITTLQDSFEYYKRKKLL